MNAHGQEISQWKRELRLKTWTLTSWGPLGFRGKKETNRKRQKWQLQKLTQNIIYRNATSCYRHYALVSFSMPPPKECIIFLAGYWTSCLQNSQETFLNLLFTILLNVVIATAMLSLTTTATNIIATIISYHQYQEWQHEKKLFFLPFQTDCETVIGHVHSCP